MSVSVPTWKRWDTFPPLVGCVTQSGGFVDIATATAVKLILKSGSALVTGSCTKATVVTPTGNTTLGSSNVTNISVMTNILVGSSVTGAGIPAGTRVGSISGTTIGLVDSNWNAVNATASGTGVTLTFNVGTVTYAWAANDLSVSGTYQQEFEVTWPGGPPTQTETFPNNSYGQINVIDDLENS